MKYILLILLIILAYNVYSAPQGYVVIGVNITNKTAIPTWNNRVMDFNWSVVRNTVAITQTNCYVHIQYKNSTTDWVNISIVPADAYINGSNPDMFANTLSAVLEKVHKANFTTNDTFYLRSYIYAQSCTQNNIRISASLLVNLSEPYFDRCSCRENQNCNIQYAYNCSISTNLSVSRGYNFSLTNCTPDAYFRIMPFGMLNLSTRYYLEPSNCQIQIRYRNKSNCLQEFATQATTCGGVAGGTYYPSNEWQDGNDLSYTTTLGNFYENFTIPPGATNESQIKWVYEWNTFYTYFAFPQSCFQTASGKLILKYTTAIPSDAEYYAYCFDDTSWIQLYSYTSGMSGYNYETKMIWHFKTRETGTLRRG